MDRGRLEEMAREFTIRAAERRTRLDDALAKREAPRMYSDSLISLREWIGMAENRPIFRLTHNREAAVSSRVHTLLDGGTTALGLSGQGQTALLIDNGYPRLTHVELKERIDRRDEFSQEQTHATHVAGTILASGVWREARGMAPSAILRSHDWNNDLAEMAQAALDGIRVSNHSYGDPLGWTPNILGDGVWGWMGAPSISATEDFRFGYYGETAHDWDAVADAAAYLLIVKSAGNERDRQGPPDGASHWVFDGGWKRSTVVRAPDGGPDGYDSIGDAGVAKNVLTVGAVEDAPWGITGPGDVVMTPFSSFGPTDDGRIKPDLVANGTSLLSSKSGSDTDYGASSGTSQAAPVVTGAALLLSELWERSFPGTKPVASTLKALILHNADEAGDTDGPDYRFGWGHLNAERAALFIHQHMVSELSLAPVRPHPVWMFEGQLEAGQTQTFEVAWPGGLPFRATLAWTDPAADVRTPLLDDPTPHLVHDLDLTAEQAGTVHLPWVLDPARPAAAAERGVNTRDNIEQVVFNAATGVVRISVSAPAALTRATQRFSLMIGTPTPIEDTGMQSTVAGVIRLGKAPLQDVNVRLSGPVERGSTTGSDGVFMVDDLPSGTYQLSVDPHLLEFEGQPMTLTLPEGAGRYDLQATSGLETLPARVFSSPRLLQSGEQGVAQDVTQVAAGGVYGVELFFREQRNVDLAGSPVILDTEYDARVAPFTGVAGDQLGGLAAGERLVRMEDGSLRFRIPVLWLDGNTPDGAVVSLPFSVRRGDVFGPLAHVDTLRLTISGRDSEPPMAMSSVRSAGLSFAPVGKDLQVAVAFLDGSGIRSASASLVDRFDTTRVWAQFPLNDSGDLIADLDYVQGDGIFSARHYPAVAADYQLRVRAEDGAGNSSDRLLPAWYTSAPFRGGGSVLFLGWNEPGSRTNAYLRELESLGETPSWWEGFVRGAIPADATSGFDRMWIGRHSVPLSAGPELERARQHVQSGRSLHLIGARPVSGGEAETWLSDATGIRVGSAVAADSVRGVGPLSGLYLSLSGENPPAELLLPGHAEPLLTSKGRVLAARSGSVVVSSVGIGHFPSEEQERVFMDALRYEETGQVPRLEAPTPVVPRPDSVLQAWTDTIRLQWDLQPWAMYRVQVATDSLFSKVDFEFETDQPSVGVGPLERGRTFFWRVEAANPAGSSGWNVPRRFLSREANLAPEILVSSDTLRTGVRRQHSYLANERYFLDPNADLLTYSAVVDSAHVVEVELIPSGIYLTPLAVGRATVLLRATDPEGLWAEVPIHVLVADNHPPRADGWPDNPQYMKPGTTRSWPLAELIVEPDDDPLAYWVYNDNAAITEARVENDHLVIEARGPGIGYMALEAHDLRGGAITESLVIQVRDNAPPRRNARISAPEFFPGDTLALALDVFVEDPDMDRVTARLVEAGAAVMDARVVSDTLFAHLNPDPLSAADAWVDVSYRDVFGDSAQVRLNLRMQDSVVMRTGDGTTPVRFEAGPSFPQPFSDRVTLPFALPAAARVRLDIFDSLGRHVAEIANRDMPAGTHRLDWRPATRLPAGNYYYQLQAGTRIRRGILVYVP